MAKYIVHKAVNADKVKKKLQRTTEEYEAGFICQNKLDGCCAAMHFWDNGDTGTYSRTGEEVLSMRHVESKLQYAFRREIKEFGGIVLLGEAWHPRLDFSTISGHFRRKNNLSRSAELDLWVFDCLTMDEFEAGHSPVGYRERMNRLTADDALDYTIASKEPGTYSIADKLAQALALGGRDGIILRDPNGTWTAGSGTTGEIVKVKRVLSFDLEVTGWEPGKGKHEGRMGALVVSFGDKELRVGTGFSDDFRMAIANHPEGDSIVGSIVEVEAMDYSSDGLLREPRFKGIRHDKLEPDTIAA